MANFRRGAAGILTLAIGDRVLDRDNRGEAVLAQVDQNDAATVSDPVEQGRERGLELDITTVLAFQALKSTNFALASASLRSLVSPF